MEVTITSENFESLKNGDKPLVVDFWATWCGPCRMVGPVISELAEEYDGKIVVGKCDVEENEELAVEFGIRNIPTILFFRDGQLIEKVVGAQPKAKIKEKFEVLYYHVTNRLPSVCSSIVTLTASSGKMSSISSGHSIRQSAPL